MRPLQLWLSNLTGTLAVQYNSSPEVIRLAVMMHIRYPLSLRQIEDLLFERGIDICETVRFWWSRFGPVFAAEIRKRRVHRRAVDHEGEVLEVFCNETPRSGHGLN